MLISDIVAKNIKRLKGEMSYVELAKKSGVSYRTLEKIVFTKEVKEPSVSTLLKLAKALKTDIGKLVK